VTFGTVTGDKIRICGTFRGHDLPNAGIVRFAMNKEIYK